MEIKLTTYYLSLTTYHLKPITYNLPLNQNQSHEKTTSFNLLRSLYHFRSIRGQQTDVRKPKIENGNRQPQDGCYPAFRC